MEAHVKSALDELPIDEILDYVATQRCKDQSFVAAYVTPDNQGSNNITYVSGTSRPLMLGLAHFVLHAMEVKCGLKVDPDASTRRLDPPEEPE